MTDAPLIAELESIAGTIKVIPCPWYCDGGFRGCDACNRCGKTGSGFRYAGKFYPNTEEGWRSALTVARS